MTVILGLIFGIIGLLIYFIPTYIAFKNDHPRKFLILLLNLFFGETLIGWVIALIWALKK